MVRMMMTEELQVQPVAGFSCRIRNKTDNYYSPGEAQLSFPIASAKPLELRSTIYGILLLED